MRAGGSGDAVESTATDAAVSGIGATKCANLAVPSRNDAAPRVSTHAQSASLAVRSGTGAAKSGVAAQSRLSTVAQCGTRDTQSGDDGENFGIGATFTHAQKRPPGGGLE